MLNVKSETTSDNMITITFPAETLQNLGISGGDEIDVTETENALILRSKAEAERTKKMKDATEKVFSRWDKVFVELAKGTDEK